QPTWRCCTAARTRRRSTARCTPLCTGSSACGARGGRCGARAPRRGRCAWGMCAGRLLRRCAPRLSRSTGCVCGGCVRGRMPAWPRSPPSCLPLKRRSPRPRRRCEPRPGLRRRLIRHRPRALAATYAAVTGALAFSCPECATVLENAGLDRQRCPADGATYERRDGIWRLLLPARATALSQFMREYETVRRSEGRGDAHAAYYRALP